MPKAIVHLDADAFFASVEQASDPRLRGKPIAVGGKKLGIIASASYEARKFGVYTPMPTVRVLKLCPKLLVNRGAAPPPGPRRSHEVPVAGRPDRHRRNRTVRHHVPQLRPGDREVSGS